MRFRLVTALALASSACGVHAQADISGSIDSCWEGSRGAKGLISDCIYYAWSGSLREAERRCAAERTGETSGCAERVKRCEAGQSAAQASFDTQISQLKRSCAAQVDAAVDRERQRAFLAKPVQPSVDGAVAKALGEERDKVRREREARRSQASKAVESFFAKLQDSSKLAGKEIVGWRWDSVSGLVVIKRKGEVAVILPLPSLENAALAKNNTELKLSCAAKDLCVVFAEPELKYHNSVTLDISATGAPALLESTNEAMRILAN